MSKKRIRANLYMESKIVFKRKEWRHIVISDPEGYLFAHGRYLTKILPTDLPEWYVYGYLYKRHGYISSKGVKHLLYVPNYTFDNHLHKDDTLFVSYNEKIEPYKTEHGSIWYKGYDEVFGGHLIMEFTKAAEKYSEYDVSDILKEIQRKRAWYYKRNPQDRPLKAMNPV